MKDEKDLSRRAMLGLIGALGASVATGCGGGESSDASGSLSTAATAKTAGTQVSAQGLQDGTDTSLEPGHCSHDLALPHTASTVADTVTAHAVSELTNNLSSILPTISSWDQQYAVLTSNADGTLNFEGAFSSEEVRLYYADKVATIYNAGGENRLNEHQGRWYDLIDTRYSVTLLPSGPTLTNLRGVFLFPTWTDGIIGEIFWNEPSWVQPFNVEDPKTLTHQLIAYEDAWRSGDVEARLATIEDQTCSAVRVTDLTGTRRSRFVAKTKDELRAAWSSSQAGTVLELTRLHHIVSTYYVFAVYRSVLRVAGEKVVRETATLLPLGPNRKFVGELSYAFESRL